MNFNPEYPIVIAFAGNAGAGKTSTANAIVPSAVMLRTDTKLPDIVWDHIFFAMPIYDMVGVRTGMEGTDMLDRTLYGMHDIVYDLLQRRCNYDDIIELVYDLSLMPCEMVDGDKPRTFMQTAGDMCRALYVDVFTNKAIRTIKQRYQNTVAEYDRHDEDPPFSFNIISDLRRINELDLIKNQPNSLLVKFIADQDELDRRLINRSGRPLTTEQKNHPTESELSIIPDSEYDIIVDTTTLTLRDQAAMVKEAILSSAKAGV